MMKSYEISSNKIILLRLSARLTENRRPRIYPWNISTMRMARSGLKVTWREGINSGGIFQNNQTILAIFIGPDAYISPSWYDHVNVPMWNYGAVHVYGKLSIIEDRSELLELLKHQVDKYEKKETGNYRLETLPQSFLETEILGVVGVSIKIDRMEANFTLSQNRDQKNYDNVIRKLQERNEEKSKEVAELMQKRNPYTT